jgi:hypothetical protein
MAGETGTEASAELRSLHRGRHSHAFCPCIWPPRRVWRNGHARTPWLPATLVPIPHTPRSERPAARSTRVLALPTDNLGLCQPVEALFVSKGAEVRLRPFRSQSLVSVLALGELDASSRLPARTGPLSEQHSACTDTRCDTSLSHAPQNVRSDHPRKAAWPSQARAFSRSPQAACRTQSQPVRSLGRVCSLPGSGSGNRTRPKASGQGAAAPRLTQHLSHPESLPAELAEGRGTWNASEF